MSSTTTPTEPEPEPEPDEEGQTTDVHRPALEVPYDAEAEGDLT